MTQFLVREDQNGIFRAYTKDRLPVFLSADTRDELHRKIREYWPQAIIQDDIITATISPRKHTNNVTWSVFGKTFNSLREAVEHLE